MAKINKPPTIIKESKDSKYERSLAHKRKEETPMRLQPTEAIASPIAPSLSSPPVHMKANSPNSNLRMPYVPNFKQPLRETPNPTGVPPSSCPPIDERNSSASSIRFDVRTWRGTK